MSKIKIRFLGTNGWYDTATGNTICILIETANEYVILDAGNGLYKVDRFIKTGKPIYLFISHFHLDHIIGLHILAKFRFKQGINLCVAKGGKRLLKAFINRPFTAPIRDLKTQIRIIEIVSGKYPIRFLEQYLRLKHIEPCFGCRLNFSGKIISYLPDTGVCDNAFTLAQNADLLIAESAFKPGQRSAAWPHLNPLDAAGIAKKAGVKQLVLAHFDAEIYQTLQERKDGEKAARRIFKNTRAVVDDQIVYL